MMIVKHISGVLLQTLSTTCKIAIWKYLEIKILDFTEIVDWKYEPKFEPINTEYGELNIHYIDEGSKNAKYSFTSSR